MRYSFDLELELKCTVGVLNPFLETSAFQWVSDVVDISSMIIE